MVPWGEQLIELVSSFMLRRRFSISGPLQPREIGEWGK